MIHLPALFCLHDWKVIDKTVLLSGMEQVASNEKLVNAKIPMGSEFFEKTVTVIISCPKCGKVKQYVTRNPAGV